ncbi:hypothetical protein [Larkinella soli]|uniref:hypothetical protein n=1 Tax=Larkinella soli TaxID=1770527 RepID=UPI000FFB8B84|nr:hypothetical protein [Larkinella soli]
MKKTVYIIEKDPVLGEQVQRCLEEDFDLEKVIRFDDLAALEAHLTESESWPSLVLVDLDPQPQAVVSAVAQLKAHPLWKKVVVLGWGEKLSAEQIHQAYLAGFGSTHDKPVDGGQRIRMIQQMAQYWLHTSSLPHGLTGP